ncbi:substrate-binding periplasmic protein [Simiduia aestuariiviva]|uniref:Polar amino acid transport system substrate-binding protein n=1 Tax=Simiduia aestuariiviva TaxID=1510459 RepID=A0A839UIY0_9GAMM|nr:transporter substrate-binding domain-containing protein [Simiduia aestuariiviva]MBB3167513.1 polar amino acid transport system substrate-binding protein [Simiduia aestuariiviva]
MEKRYLVAMIGCLMVVASAFAGPAHRLDQLTYLSENSPPMNFLDNGEFKGIAVDLLERTTRVAGTPVHRDKVKILPWARAYRAAISGPNKVIFAIYRTPEREALFKWAGPFDANSLVLVAKKNRKIKITQLSQLNKFVVGAQREDAAEIHLRNLSLDEMVLTLTVSPLQLARMMQADRIDIWAGGVHGINAHLAMIGAAPEDFEVVGTLHKADLYFAFSRDVDDALVDRFQQSLEKVLSQQAGATKASH